MTSTEKLVAETAFDRRQAQKYESIHDEVSKLIGISAGEIKTILDHLSHKAIVKPCVTPAHNLAEAPRDPNEVTWAWYEKGDSWPN